MLKIGMLVILLFMACLPLISQEEYDLPEETRMLLFSSVEYDGTRATMGTLDEWVQVARNHYEYLEVVSSPVEVMYKPSMSDSISGKYEVKLYKILSRNSAHQSRYLLWFKDFSSEVWLRVSGYVENDLYLFFEYLKEDMINDKALRGMLHQWKIVNPLFAELDWRCLYKGYNKKTTTSYCFRSAYYVFVNDTCIGCNPPAVKQVNSIFSRLPLYGSFQRY